VKEKRVCRNIFPIIWSGLIASIHWEYSLIG